MAIMVVPIKKMAELCATINAWDIFTGILMMLGTVAAIGMLLTHWSKNSLPSLAATYSQTLTSLTASKMNGAAHGWLAWLSTSQSSILALSIR
jgi:protein-disulfide isomerase-like protein with CxxC motif